MHKVCAAANAFQGNFEKHLFIPLLGKNLDTFRTASTFSREEINNEILA